MRVINSLAVTECFTVPSAPESRIHKSSTFRIRRTKSKKIFWTPNPTPLDYSFDGRVNSLDRPPQFFNKFTPMNSCDVFLYFVVRSMFILA